MGSGIVGVHDYGESVSIGVVMELSQNGWQDAEKLTIRSRGTVEPSARSEFQGCRQLECELLPRPLGIR